MKNRGGFSLIEVLIYIVIFAVSAVFLVSILTVVTRIQLKQASSHELQQQLSFIGDVIQRMVQKSSLIDIDAGVATTTLRLRMSASSTDTTLVYASSGIIYLEEVNTSGVSNLTPLTDSNVTVDSFYITKYENPGGYSVAQIDITMSYNTDNIQADDTRTLQTAVTRISAATFDSDLNPNADNSLNLGASGTKWKQGYFSGTLQVGDYIQLIGSTGNIATTIGGNNVGNGLIVKDSTDGFCYKIFTTSSVVTSVAVSCP